MAEPFSTHLNLCSADKIKDVLVRHEIQGKVALLVTDNAANMLKARRLTIQAVGFKHILEMRLAPMGQEGGSIHGEVVAKCSAIFLFW